MTFREAYRKCTKENREYFKYKYPEVRFDKSKPPKTEEELLKATNRKTMNGFLEWEKTQEYQTLVALYLQTKVMNDIEKIYDVVREKALDGDDKAITTFLKLNKEINLIIKVSAELTSVEDDEDDGLIMNG